MNSYSSKIMLKSNYSFYKAETHTIFNRLIYVKPSSNEKVSNSGHLKQWLNIQRKKEECKESRIKIENKIDKILMDAEKVEL